MAETAESVFARFQINRLAALSALAGRGLGKIDDVGGLGGSPEARLGIGALARADRAAGKHERSEKQGKQGEQMAAHTE